MKMLEKLKTFYESLRKAMSMHPAELLILIHATVSCCYFELSDNTGTTWARLAALSPFFVVAAYSLKGYLRRFKWLRFVYLAIPLLYAACAFIAPVMGWIGTFSFYLWVFALLPMWMMLRRFHCQNYEFLDDNVGMVWSALLAGFVTVAIYVLVFAIIWSANYVFDLDFDLRNIAGVMASILFVLFMPMLFFTLESRRGTVSFSGFMLVLLNYILTPALLIYNVVLYVYLVFILARWDLPKGHVATMVSAFIVIALLAKTLQQFLERRPFFWYYKYFSWFALPVIFLFWVGTLHRIFQYGITPQRYYLLLLGGLMTLFLALFLFRNKHGYFALVCVAFVCTAATLLPCLSAERISLASQVQRVRTNAASMGLLNADGTLILQHNADAGDTLYRAKHRAIYQSMKFIAENDSNALIQQLGVHHASDYLQGLSQATADYATAYRMFEYDAEEATDIDVNLYAEERQYLYVRWPYDKERPPFNCDTYSHAQCGLNIMACDSLLFGLTMDSLLTRQLRKCGIAEGEYITQSWADEHYAELLTMRWRNYRIEFSEFSISCATKDSTNHYTFAGGEIAVVMW